QDGIEQAWVHTKLRHVENDDQQVVDIRIYDAAERPVAELDGLTVRLLPLEKVQRPRAADDFLYRVAWRQGVRGIANARPDRAPASWLIFADSKGIGVVLANQLEARGHRCHFVLRGDAFAQQGGRKWTVNERRPEDFRRLLAEFAAGETLACAGVGYLWGLDAPTLRGTTLGGLKAASEMMCRGALAIVHALAETRATHQTGRRLWLVTANAQNPDGRPQQIDPVQAPLWGLGRTIAIEYPGI